jgi:hypothetical protein
MYSRSDMAVDKGIAMELPEKGLGFDFSAITDLVKTALPVGLNIFQQQMQLKQVQAAQRPGYIQSPGVYGQGYGQVLPFSTAMQPQPTFGQPMYAQPSSGMSTTTMLAIGAAAVVGLLAFKMLR